MSVSKLCEALVEDQVQLKVFTTTANGKEELNVSPNQQSTVDGVPVTYFKRLTKDHTHFSPALLIALRKEIKEQNNPLIIHIHAWWNLVSIFSCIIAKWYNIPVILSPRGMLTDYTTGNRNASMKNLIHKVIGKNLLKYCHIHATSEQEKQDVLRFIQPKSITIIPNLVNLPSHEESKTEKLKPQPENPFQLIFLSRIEEKKGLELLFESLVDLPFNWELIIAGTGEERYVESLKDKAEYLKINIHIKWLGHVANDDKFQLIAENDLLILTSYNENFANVVIESLSVGTPVLISDQVGLADYVEINELGWTTDLSIDKITSKIQEAYDDINKRLLIRDKAPDIIYANYNTEILAARYLNLYHSI